MPCYLLSKVVFPIYSKLYYKKLGYIKIKMEDSILREVGRALIVRYLLPSSPVPPSCECAKRVRVTGRAPRLQTGCINLGKLRLR